MKISKEKNRQKFPLVSFSRSQHKFKVGRKKSLSQLLLTKLPQTVVKPCEKIKGKKNKKINFSH
jgi:hypothetical protein